MDLLVIRHGQSEADILKVIEGRADFNLTELGYQQASLMAEWVSRYMTIDKIISSTLKRAKQTADNLSKIINVPVEYDDLLMEWKNGLIAGLTFEEADKRYPLPENKYPHTAIYEQESMIEFRMRAEIILSRIINESPSKSKIAIISHGKMINMLFRSFLELPISTDVSISSGDTGIHHWKIDDTERRIIKINSLVHIK
jgi:2,3-bisphosphoglycerate-dependent phosphoglycerate mutase